MANYKERTRTNYFHVTDEKRYQELFGRLKGSKEKRIKFSTSQKQMNTEDYFTVSEATAPLIITQNLTVQTANMQKNAVKQKIVKKNAKQQTSTNLFLRCRKSYPRTKL